MKSSSRSRKIGISGSHTAPMRSAASEIVTNSSLLGSWKATGSPGLTPELEQGRRGAVDVLAQLAPGELARDALGVDGDHRAPLRALGCVAVEVVEDQIRFWPGRMRPGPGPAHAPVRGSAHVPTRTHWKSLRARRASVRWSRNSG